MSSETSNASQTRNSIHPKTSLGAVHYAVLDLEKQARFYRDSMGFYILEQTQDRAVLGSLTSELLYLTQASDTIRKPPFTTGLYHTAFAVPSRQDLAYLLQRLITTQTPMTGMSDHYTHLALYLNDPEGNGIELMWDFPREKWQPLMEQIRQEGPEAMLQLRAPIHTAELLADIENSPAEWPGLPPNSRVGHVHLQVADIAKTKHFYNEVLGFDLMIDGPRMNMAFFGANGYHHHIGTNAWRTKGAAPAPENSAGLRYFTIVLPDNPALQQVLDRLQNAQIPTQQIAKGVLVRDPAHIGILLTTA